MNETALLGPDANGIERAAEALRKGHLVAFPTETVYGLGADATNPEAVASVFAAKQRPSFNPLIAHVADTHAAGLHGVFGPAAKRLADLFWPGPLTLVVPHRPQSGVCDLARAGLETIALRVPDHPIALRLLRSAGRPVVGPSANRSGHVSPTTAQHVLDDLDGRIAAVIDGGATAIGVESTVVFAMGETAMLLRPGAASRVDLETALGASLARNTEALGEGDPARPAGPGLLASHYAPAAWVRLEATTILPGEAVITFGSIAPPGLDHAAAVINLSPSGDLSEAAAALFAALRTLDASGATTIAVTPIPQAGLGEAINDRLRRAAAPRDSVSDQPASFAAI